MMTMMTMLLIMLRIMITGTLRDDDDTATAMVTMMMTMMMILNIFTGCYDLRSLYDAEYVAEHGAAFRSALMSRVVMFCELIGDSS